MNYFEVVGIEVVDYVSRKGVPVKGVKLHTLTTSDRVAGHVAESFYIRDSVDVRGISIGDTIDIRFDRYGSVSGVDVVDTK